MCSTITFPLKNGMVLDLIKNLGKKEGTDFLVNKCQEHGLHANKKLISIRIARLREKLKSEKGERVEEIMASTFDLSRPTPPAPVDDNSVPTVSTSDVPAQTSPSGDASEMSIDNTNGSSCEPSPSSSSSNIDATIKKKSDSGDSFSFSKSTTLEDLRKLSKQFIKERNWDQFHSPRNVLLALVGEVGELAEIFQWKGEVSEGLPELSQAERDHVGEEMSDVLLYLIDMAERCRIDLPKAVLDKMAANGRKYPVDKAYGKATKYTDL